MELHRARSSGAQNLALYLGGLAGIAALGGIATEIAGVSVFGLGGLFAAHFLLAGLAVLAAALEWGRERLAEAASTAAVALAIVLTFVDLASGFWYYAPFLGIAALGNILALTDRYMQRDEATHAPRMWVQASH